VANEVTISATLDYEDAEGTEDSLQVLLRTLTSTGKQIMHHKQVIGITEEAIVLGEVTSIGMALFVNRDVTNFVELRVSTGGAKFAKLHPDTNGDGKGGIALLYMGSGAQVPFAISDTAACKIEYFLVMQ
jgi:hypothetical protein